MTPIKRLKVYVLGERDYPEALITVPEPLVRDLPDLVARARAINPATSVDRVVQTIWRLGSWRLDQNLRHHIPVKVALSAKQAVPTRPARQRVIGHAVGRRTVGARNEAGTLVTQDKKSQHHTP